MTGPAPLCVCSHNKMSHEVEGAPACCHDDCGCPGYRPLRPGQPATLIPAGNDVRSLIQAGKDCGAKRIVGLAERIEAQLEQLREQLRDERARAAARLEVAELEKRLAAARRKVRQTPHKPRGNQAGIYPCPEPGCTEVRPTPQGIGSHRRHDHGYRRTGVHT